MYKLYGEKKKTFLEMIPNKEEGRPASRSSRAWCIVPRVEINRSLARPTIYK